MSLCRAASRAWALNRGWRAGAAGAAGAAAGEGAEAGGAAREGAASPEILGFVSFTKIGTPSEKVFEQVCIVRVGHGQGGTAEFYWGLKM